MLRERIQLRAIAASLALALTAGAIYAPPLAWGVEMESLYTVDVPFDRQAPDARSDDYARAVG